MDCFIAVANHHLEGAVIQVHLLLSTTHEADILRFAKISNTLKTIPPIIEGKKHHPWAFKSTPCNLLFTSYSMDGKIQLFS